MPINGSLRYLFIFFSVDQRPSMRDINKYIVPKFSAHWRMLGILLDVRSTKLDDIAKNEDDQKCSKEMLKQWLHTDGEATWRKLLEAVSSVPK